MVDSSYDDLFLNKQKGQTCFEKTVLPRRSAQAALKTSCLDISDHSMRGVFFGMPGLQSPAVARVFRQFCKRYSVEEGDRSLLIYYPIKRLACQEGNCNNFKKNREFFLPSWGEGCKSSAVSFDELILAESNTIPANGSMYINDLRKSVYKNTEKTTTYKISTIQE